MKSKQNFLKVARNPLKLQLFFLKKMPMGILSGMRIKSIDSSHAKVSIPFNYLTKNPFQSVYFAVQTMAAELSSGALAISEVMKAPKPVSMLVFQMDGNFTKKARSKVIFTCNDGKAIANAIKKTIETGEGETVTITSTGTDEEGDVVSVFHFTWTFKVKSK